MQITPVNFAWPLESVFEVDSTGTVQDQRYAFSFNALQLFAEEDSSNSFTSNRILRIIRGEKGYYYMTAEGFKNVYLFAPGESNFDLAEKVLIDEEGISNPAFNQRTPFVELIYNDGKSIFLSSTGIIEKGEAK
jgi:hypothetical protein